MTVNPKPVLIRAREIISDPEHWTQFEYATDNAGAPVEPWDEDAYCFCLVGALDRASVDLDLADASLTNDPDFAHENIENLPEVSAALRSLQSFVPGLVSDFNDDHEHSEVLELLDKAIAA